MSRSAHNKLVGTFGTIQIAAHDQDILVDTTTRNYDTVGHLHVDRSFARLSIADAYRLLGLLGQAIVVAEESEPRQPGLWSNASLQAIARRIA